ncbi:MAG: nucleotidyl transferase AbiEii/AbiGii toxin family protein [Pseudohongiellaceae bacterium]
MIPHNYITEWRTHAPWIDDAQVEQDLVISRALVNIFSNEVLGNSLAFRGGTALYKLYLPATRYSEDIDLVQISAEPAGAMMQTLREVLDTWLGEPNYEQKGAGITFMYRFQSEDGKPLRLKVEINTREHLAIEGIKSIPFKVDSRWFSDSCYIRSYELNELLGTKLRALYQRKKGRDIFDLATALEHVDADPEKIIASFYAYMKHSGNKITRKKFMNNVNEKLKDENFTSDISPLLALDYKPDIAIMAEKVKNLLISRLAD